MRIIAKLGTGLCFTGALAFGLTEYRGQLMDASCYNGNSSMSTSADRAASTAKTTSGEKAWVRCAPTDTTTSFALHTNGKVRMLDTAGNEKATSAMKQGLLKKDNDGDMHVIVDGKRDGNTIKVESIRAHKSDTSVH